MGEKLTDAERYWGKSYDYGWYGEFAGAFREADIFHKFDPADLGALAEVAHRVVNSVQMKECDSVMMLRPGVRLECTEHKGHAGRHNDQEWSDDG